MKRKVLINVAPVAGSCKEIIPEKIAEDVLACRKAGAAMVHLHVRAKDGSLSPDPSLLKEILKIIHRDSDIIIEVSTGGISNMNIQERCAAVSIPEVECCSLNVGSTNLGDAAYVNIPKDVDYCISELLKYHKIPEVETFEIGHSFYMQQLMQKYALMRPVLFSIVLGHPGEAPATAKALQAMVDFIPQDALWGITHAHRKNFDLIAAALGMGASTVRVGFEDSNMLNADHSVETNAPLVEKTASLIKACDLEIMSPDEARALLHIGYR